jgi:predicted phage tail protein
LALAITIFGSLIAGIAFTEPLFGPGLGTFIFSLGDAMILGGLVWFLIVLIERLRK